ncbi:MAG: SDR family oxidoreductase [Tenuifilaceae bacterium]
MKILITGATGYIGKRLLPALLEQGHEVICCVRDKNRLTKYQASCNIQIWEVDFLEPVDLNTAPIDFDAAYYLIHSMSNDSEKFEYLEKLAALNFRDFVNKSNAKQVIYLSGLANAENLSKHIESRRKVEDILRSGSYATTVLRAGVIVGSGSASFEMIRDLTEKLPLVITPSVINTRCQPISIRNVIQYLKGVLLNEKTFNNIYDIGGPEVLTYKEMILQYAKMKDFNRLLIVVPFYNNRVAAFLLSLISSITYHLSLNLINSMKVEMVCKNNDLEKLLGIKSIDYKTALSLAFERIEQNMVLSSWKDALSSSSKNRSLLQFIEIPQFGTYSDKREILINSSVDRVLDNIWAIGGERGWYFANILWGIRGIIDKLFGGIGLRRGRTNNVNINSGDALDFWRVIVSDRQNMRLLLYAEMKVPGEAWLEFKVNEKNGNFYLEQNATFRPFGLLGRVYWYSLLPIHIIIFKGMIRNIENYEQKPLKKLIQENKTV